MFIFKTLSAFVRKCFLFLRYLFYKCKQMEYFIDVIVPLSLPNTFTYKVTQAEYNFLKIGCRVIVPFGKSKIYTALVVNLHQNAPLQYEAKDIITIVDDFPVVTSIQLEF